MNKPRGLFDRILAPWRQSNAAAGTRAAGVQHPACGVKRVAHSVFCCLLLVAGCFLLSCKNGLTPERVRDGATFGVGSVQLTSVPAGATVWLDGANTDRVTDCMIDDVGAKIHALKLTIEDKLDWDTTLVVIPSETTVVGCKLLPYEAGFCSSLVPAYAVAVSGNFALLGGGAPGLRVIDISNPQVPTEVGSCAGPGNVMSVAISGNYAYAASWDSTGVHFDVIDLLDPHIPVLLGRMDLSSDCHGIVVSGYYALLATYPGLLVVNIWDHQRPTAAGYCYTATTPWDVALVGNYAYVANIDSGISIIDLVAPSNPTKVGSFPISGRAFCIAANGGRLYAAGWDSLGSHLDIISISDQLNPYREGVLALQAGALDIALGGNYVYAAAAGLAVIDASNPGSPSEAGSYPTSDGGWGLAVAGDYAYLADGYGGMRVIRVAK